LEIIMESASIPEPAGFGQLPKIEQIRYVQRLWNIISENSYDVPVPPSHLELAERRLADYRRDPTSARPAYEVIDRLRGKGR
jgi:putative addiction module component (TIGR02574 family)